MSAPARDEPFVGPQAFTAADSWRFFGRDREIADLADILTAARVVLLYSPSGAGKSSLINAALIPRFQEQFRVLPVISVGKAPDPPAGGAPGNRYVMSALLSMESALPEPERLPPGELEGTDLASWLTRRREQAGDDRPELLVFDQFEEILSIDPIDLDAKTVFFEQVGEALRDRHRWALFAMREEYDARLDPYRRLVPTGLTTRFRLDLLGTDAAIQAIWRPTRDLPVKITVEAAEKIVTDLSQVQSERDGEVVTRQGPHVDPVQLQVVCLRLWRNLRPGTTEVTAEDIDRTGTNVTVALAEYYDETVAAASERTGVPERTIRAWIGDHLITRHGVRNRVLREPGESQGLDDRVIDRLIGAYLLRTVPGEATWVELAHDRLVPPVRQSNDAWFRDNLSVLQRHAEAWDKGGRTADLLLPAGLLRDARAWARENPEQVTSVEREYLAASDAARARLLWRRLAPAALALIVILGALAGWAFWERGQKQDEADAAANAEVLAEMRAGEAADAAGTAQAERRSAEANAIAASEARATADAARATAEAQASLSRTQALAAQAPDQHAAGDDERGALLARQAYLLDAAQDGRMRDLVDTSLRTVLSQPWFSTRLDHDDVVIAAVFSADGSHLTTVTGPLNVSVSAGYRPVTVWRWDLHEAGVDTFTIDWSGMALTAVAIDPEGAWLAVGTGDGAMWLWDLRRPGDGPVTLRETGYPLGALAFSADGDRLAAGYADGGLELWDVAEPRGAPEPLPAGDVAITSLAFRPDGTILAAGRADGTVELWDVERDGITPLRLAEHRGAVGALAFSPDGALLATASSDATARLWAIPSGEALGGPIASDGALAFSPDGQTLAVARADRTIALLDPADLDAEPVTLVGHGDAVRALAFSADGATLATGSADGTARLWELGAPAAAPVVVVEGRAGQSAAVAGAVISAPDGSFGYATLDRDGMLRQAGVDAAAPQVTMELRGGAGGVTAIALGGDGTTLATGGRDGTVQLWVQGTQMPGPPAQPGSRRAVTALAFSPNGETLAIGGSDGTIRLWDTTGDGRDAGLRGPRVAITALAFDPDGRRLVSGGADGTIHLWDLGRPTPRPRALLAGGNGITALAFDGETLATGEADGAVRLWLASRPEAAPIVLRGPAIGPVTALALNPDGAILFALHADGSVRSWIARTDVLAGIVCQQVRRNLTLAEWDQFVGPNIPYEPTCAALPPGEGAPGVATPAAMRRGGESA